LWHYFNNTGFCPPWTTSFFPKASTMQGRLFDPTRTTPVTSNLMLFKDLSLIEPLLRALETEGYESPTPIQEQAIPPVLEGRDLLGCAQTGTGKTAAFALPILQKLHNERTSSAQGRKIRTLILTPTRELAIQIGESFTAYGRHTTVKNLVIFGGVSQHAQTQALQRGAEVIIATPGRLLDLMNQGFVSLRDLSIFVLDEADRMLDMGFIHDVKKVIAKLPAKRQTLFFSATMPAEISGLAGSILTDPIKVAVTPVSSTAEKIAQAVYFVEKQDKRLLLNHLLDDKTIKSALVFTRTKHGANKVAADLVKSGIGSEAIHGNKSQNARQAALSGFKNGRIRVLVATDIAARGIDIDDLTHVVNYDLPNIPETYVHRIGRTGRAGASGIALSFCDGEEVAYLKDIQKLTGQLVPVVEDHPYPADLSAPALPQPAQRNQRQGQQQRKPQREQRPANQPHNRSTGEGSNRNEPRPQREQPSQQQRNQRDERPQRNNDARPPREQQPQRNDARPPRSDARPPREQQPQRSEQFAEQRPQRNEQRPQREPNYSNDRREETPTLPERKNRFASILEVSKLEKQPSYNKPKPAYKERTSDAPRSENSPRTGNTGRAGWRGNDRAKKTTKG
jgi:ATP-dependent RNA helicase RhlE